MLEIKLNSSKAKLPVRTHPTDAGLDLTSIENLTIAPGERAIVDTGVAIALEPNTVGLVCPRSGLALKNGISPLNAPGIIDEEYRGNLKVVLQNSDPNESFEVKVGDRIAQLLIMPVLLPELRVVDELSDAARGDKGFGSSGVTSA